MKAAYMNTRGYGNHLVGLTNRSAKLIENAKVTVYHNSIIGHSETEPFYKYELPDGTIYYDQLQVAISLLDTGERPWECYALVDNSGEWIRDTLWTDAEVQLAAKGIKFSSLKWVIFPPKVEIYYPTWRIPLPISK